MFDFRNLKDMSRAELIEEIKDLQSMLLESNEKIDKLITQSKEYDSFFGYSNNMSFEDKLNHTKSCEEEIKLVEESLDEDIKHNYIKENEIGDRMVDIALEMNQIHFDCAELFHPIKDNISEEEYKLYKKHKRNFYAMISCFYDIKKNNKEEVFDILLRAIRMQKRVYSLDNELKNLSN